MFDAEQETLLNLAAAVEMMHTATQVHDHLTSIANQRHGQVTLNTRFATSATVLAGDLAFAAAAQLAAATNRITVMEKFSETLQIIISGEITHMFNNGNRRDQEAYFGWIRAKTASVFELASGMGATIGSASPAEIGAATQFGHNIGMAFQITDDILDFAGDPSALGKPAGSNLRQGIITLPTLFYLEAHPNDMDLIPISKGNGNGLGHIESIITAIRQSDAIDQAAREADRFLQLGLEALARLPDTPERTKLSLLASEVTNLDLVYPSYV
jgi:geranylgeranyl pyrophosphate synthase